VRCGTPCRRIGDMHVCGPLPCRHQKEARRLPVFVVKRLQLQQRVFDCVPRQRVFDCVPRPKPLMKAMSEVLG
jgi:hypothetical protein